MRIAIVGTGYVGLISGACFADVGHTVICMDKDAGRIALLNAGRMPIFEPGLEAVVWRNRAADRLHFTADLARALQGAEAVFLAVGTPQASDGSADLSMILDAAEQIGRTIVEPVIVVQKSTCPVGTTREIERRIARALERRGLAVPFTVVSNPEFLREGNAVTDFLNPDRVVIGADDSQSARRIAALYATLAPAERIFIMDRASAELTKYAANAFLATKISFMNEIANLCEQVGADVEQVRRGVGSDSRIGPAFLAAGIGYGGSCFPKDVRALLKTAGDCGETLQLVEAADRVNQAQQDRQVEKVTQHFGGDLAGRRIAVWGLAFKPGTDDMRESPAIRVTDRLLALGAQVVAYDPAAMSQAERILDPEVFYAPDALACVLGADALILVTDWPEFLNADLEQVGERMANRVIFDFRNALAPTRALEAGFTYVGVGRGSPVVAEAAAD